MDYLVLHRRINFAMEKEQNNILPLLDVLVERREYQFSTAIYMKPTHTDNHYLNYRSNHHPRVKNGIVQCLRTQALRIYKQETIEEETTRLRAVFQLE